MAQIIETISKEYSISPFDVLNVDFDDFAVMVNYMMERSEGSEKKRKEVPTGKSNGETRIRVNDETATGGWF